MKRIFALLLCFFVLLPGAALAGRYDSVRLIAQDYSLEGGAIEAGGQAVLRVAVQNTNAYQAAGNLVFTITDPQGRLIPQGPSGVYVNEIPRGGQTEIEFSLMAMPDALPGYAKLVLQAEYETADGRAETMQADLYLEIAQPMRLEHSIAALPAKATEGENLAFSMDFLNMGKGVVYNVLMAFDVPGLNGGSAVLVGNIEPGETKTGRANLLVSDLDGLYGETEGTLTLRWENAAGAAYEEELPLSTVIAPKPVIPAPSEKKAEEENLLPAWLPGTLIAAAGVVLVVGIQIGLERRRRRERDERLL